ncbi:MAG: four helix bundle protein [Candidatus Moranbacteria bacterium]|nr:four helix bundle protein [Candidatus Moranbacteria bacterium]
MDDFSEKLKLKMDLFVHGVYKCTKKFPREEIYGVTSQIRRASLSVVLNYIEGYARKRNLVKKNFWEISYGSLQESKYLLKFSFDECLIEDKSEYDVLLGLSDEIGAMLWKSMESITTD